MIGQQVRIRREGAWKIGTIVRRRVFQQAIHIFVKIEDGTEVCVYPTQIYPA